MIDNFKGDMNRKDNFNMTLMMYAAETVNCDCIEILKEAGADVNEGNGNQRTALMIAIENRNISCVEKLLEAGADVNSFQEGGSTALITAAKCSITALVRKLLLAGAHINFINNRGENALKVHLSSPHFKPNDTAILLYAAGEKLEDFGSLVPDVLKNEIQNRELKHLCRQAIRKHLIKLNPHLHLFNRLPKFQLPKLLTDYLLYDMSLDK